MHGTNPSMAAPAKNRGSPQRPISQVRGPNPAFVENSALLLDAMANANRLHVLTIISKGEVSVGSLSEMIGLSESALSQHLSKLRAGGLVKTRRDAQTIYYSCSSDAVLRILATLSSFFEGPAIDE